MKREISEETRKGAYGRYVPEGEESQPQCMWCWDKKSREVRDYVGLDDGIVIGYADEIFQVLER